MESLYVIVGKYAWHDCGTLDSLYSVNIEFATPEHRNVSIGDIKREGCWQSYFRAEPGHRIEAYGIKNAAIVATFINGKPVLVACERKLSQKIRDIAEEFENTGRITVSPEHHVIWTASTSEKCAFGIIGLPGIDAVVTDWVVSSAPQTA